MLEASVRNQLAPEGDDAYRAYADDEADGALEALFAQVGAYEGTPGSLMIDVMPTFDKACLGAPDVKIMHIFTTGWALGNFKGKRKDPAVAVAARRAAAASVHASESESEEDEAAGTEGIYSGRDAHEQSLDTACKIEFCIRNQVKTADMYRRSASEFFGGSHVQRCASCMWIGHNNRTCWK
ncbi:hypothetical protein T492DRAFT_911502 [Pavlovales sp. CCMP2436]|nr:hypothetical protein T492DRAFT_911502 [Pavlovales sp. CCMP2436]